VPEFLYREDNIIMTKQFILFFVVGCFLLTAGCAPRNLVVLVPDPDGSVGSISVSNEAGNVVIDSPYHSTRIKDRQRVPDAPVAMKKEKIDSIFSDAMAAQPELPVHFLLYFENCSTDLTADSISLIPHVIETIQVRNTPIISVIGHTDTLGDKDHNLRLSSQRAESVGQLLIENGVAADKIEMSSHGEENLLIKTRDNVSEPKNRRVEIIVR
jgi:outer membrane protein OmpA-like peptidoglycan-associated protein